jgi:hypothetical protein
LPNGPPANSSEKKFFFHLLSDPGTKKALQMDLESPLTHNECFGILWHLSVPQGPQVFQPGTATRQSLVPGFFNYFSAIYRILPVLDFHVHSFLAFNILAIRVHPCPQNRIS